MELMANSSDREVYLLLLFLVFLDLCLLNTSCDLGLEMQKTWKVFQDHLYHPAAPWDQIEERRYKRTGGGERFTQSGHSNTSSFY